MLIPFLAAFVEKILRVSPRTRNIFLLVKAKDKEQALNRVKAEVCIFAHLSRSRFGYGCSF